MDELQVVATQIGALLAEHAHEIQARGVPLQASSTKRYLAERLRLKDITATRMLELGKTLSDRPALAQAVHTGAVNLELVAIITAALTTIQDAVPAATVDQAEQFLVDQVAQGLGPKQIAACGEAILHHVAPEVADELDQRRRQRDEAAAARRRELTIGPAVHGSHRIHGWLDTEAVAVLTAVLEPLAQRRPTIDGITDHRSRPERLADALHELGHLHLHDGQHPGAQLAITIGYHGLLHGLSPGLLDTGQPIPAESVRRMACTAQLIPVVLGGAGQVLDVGRARRLFDGPLRRALEIRDQGCAFPGCHRPARYTQAHHIVAWWAGGDTSLANGVLLCLPHHKEIHHGHWTVHIGADGHPEFVPPPHVDPLQRPRRNNLIRPTGGQ